MIFSPGEANSVMKLSPILTRNSAGSFLVNLYRKDHSPPLEHLVESIILREPNTCSRYTLLEPAPANVPLIRALCELHEDNSPPNAMMDMAVFKLLFIAKICFAKQR